jgi:L-amino acid N-acyltransferase YncA
MNHLIRLAKEDDAARIAEIYRPYVETSPATFELVPPSEADFKTRISTVLPFAPWLVFESDDRILGYAYASQHHERAAYQWCVNTAVYIREGCHRQGIGRALYTSLIACLKLQGFYAAHAGATLPNAGTVGLHEAMGFQRIGVYPAVGYKLGAWHDVIWWQLPLRERVGEPRPPLTTRQAGEGERKKSWEDAIRAGKIFL